MSNSHASPIESTIIKVEPASVVSTPAPVITLSIPATLAVLPPFPSALSATAAALNTVAVSSAHSSLSSTSGTFNTGRPTGCRDVLDFEVLAKIGEGTYGVVYRARDPRSGALVALKHIKFIEGFKDFALPTLREIRALRYLQHPNVVQLQEIATGKPDPAADRAPGGHVYMVFSYAEHDLAGLLRMSRRPSSGFAMTPDLVRSYMHQLLLGLAHCHSRGWVHRDIKTANLLVTTRNQLSIADFGLAKKVDSGRATPEVVTMWYRPPELLYQDPTASFPIDMWSAGCVFGEMLSERELFCGHDSLSQITMIYKLCGAPDLSGWPGIQQCKPFLLLRPKVAYAPQFRTRFPRLGPLELDLLTRLLCINPHKRITAEAALQHPYFMQGGHPPPLPSTLPAISLESAHELEVRDATRAVPAPPAIGRAAPGTGALLQRPVGIPKAVAASSKVSASPSGVFASVPSPLAGLKRLRPETQLETAIGLSETADVIVVAQSAPPAPTVAPVPSTLSAALAKITGKTGGAKPRARGASSSVSAFSATASHSSLLRAPSGHGAAIAPTLPAAGQRLAQAHEDDEEDSSNLFV